MGYLEDLFGLEGKIAVVTGGSRGIGQTVSVGLARAGAEVVILCRSEPSETLEMIAQVGGKAGHIAVDVTDEQAVESAFDEIIKSRGSVDVVFNNAGICIHKPTLEASLDEWRRVLDVNLNGVYMVCRAAGRVMAQNGIHGSIVNNASMSGTVVNVPQWQCSYNASKAAVLHLTRSLAVEWARYGIRVNSISPGYTATAMSVDTPEELKNAWMPLIPMGRMGEPEELVGAVVYLASGAAAYTTGADIIVDGGYVCR